MLMNSQVLKTNSKSSDKTTDKHRENIDNVNEILEKTKLALAFFTDNSGKCILTKDEALTGVYESKKGDKSQNKQLYKVLLINIKCIKNALKNMKFDTVYPPKRKFASIIGISKDKVYVGGTQTSLGYADKNPMENEKTRQESKPNENPNTNSHMRTQVYQIIEELYGHPIDREKI
ncbi:hypothetical protein BUZ06_12765 [Staphylococcus gallinarum]|nr:hypothetical protein BUZ05_10920 [Staphylococcus gallinarum]PTK90916.1 hypothetical protein BUZ13_09795 [Staphylococcus gallinarum]RIO86715.1 hypothetical protein BUZ06_12765 [Staphylococcus gallinarum]